MKGVLCKYNKNEEKKIGHQTHIYCVKKEEWIPIYKCGKGSCKDHKFNIEIVVQVPVGRCDECPMHYTKATPYAGCATDYYCKITGIKTSSYVEYDDEINPVPESCPFRWPGKTMEGV